MFQVLVLFIVRTAIHPIAAKERQPRQDPPVSISILWHRSLQVHEVHLRLACLPDRKKPDFTKWMCISWRSILPKKPSANMQKNQVLYSLSAENTLWEGV